MQFQSLMQNQAMDETIRKRLQERFVKNNENQVQVGLVEFLNESIDEFVFYHISRVPAIEFT